MSGAVKFHINNNGEPSRCSATQGNCPFGGESGTENHFDNKEDAWREVENRYSNAKDYLKGSSAADIKGYLFHRNDEQREEFKKSSNAAYNDAAVYGAAIQKHFKKTHPIRSKVLSARLFLDTCKVMFLNGMKQGVDKRNYGDRYANVSAKMSNYVTLSSDNRVNKSIGLPGYQNWNEVQNSLVDSLQKPDYETDAQNFKEGYNSSLPKE